MNYILDASVILKWFLKEEDTDKALEIKQSYILGEIDLIEPDLLLYEFTNGLRFQKGINEKEINEAIEDLFTFQINFITPTISSLKFTNSIALEYNTTVYDAFYISLAKETNSYFITSDSKLFDKISSLPYVKMLSGLSL